MKKIITVLLVSAMILTLSSCSVDLHKWFPNIIKEETTTSKDVTTYVAYTDIKAFREDLESGKDVTGMIVSFKVTDIVYAESDGEFNIYKAGEHVNFISDRKIDTAVGRTMVVEVTQVDNVDGQYWAVNFTIPT